MDSTSPETRVGSAYPRRRVMVACDTCRFRKTRCDGKRPSCGFCSSLSIPCVYRRPPANPTNNSCGDQASDDQNPDLSARLWRLERELQELRQSSDNNVNANLSSPSGDFHHHTPGSSEIIHAARGQASPIITQSSLEDGNDMVEQWEATPSPGFSTSHASRGGHGPNHEHENEHEQESNLVPSPGPHLFGLNLVGWASLAGHASNPLLQSLTVDSSEAFVEIATRQGDELDNYQATSPQPPRIDVRTSLRLYQAFIRNVLPWFPIFHAQEYADIVTKSQPNSISTPPGALDLIEALKMCVLALGAASRTVDHVTDLLEEAAGITYFSRARNILRDFRGSKNNIIYVQSQILLSLYLLNYLRPLQAFEEIHKASTTITYILHQKERLRLDPPHAQACYRAFWACYLVEYELRPYVASSSLAISMMRGKVPLPHSDREEPGIFWFLSEIALRNLYADVLTDVFFVPRSSHTIYAPIISEELNAQLERWYLSLPPRMGFPRDSSLLPDPLAAFLRTQYYALLCMMKWPSMVRFLTDCPAEGLEDHAALGDAALATENAAIYIDSVEFLVHDRHILLPSLICGLHTFTLILLTLYHAPNLEQVAPPDAILPTIRKGRSLIATWADNPVVALYLSQIDDLMEQKDIDPERG